METQSINPKDIEQMKNDLELIKKILLARESVEDEGELTDWASNELLEARNRKEKLSHDEVREKILEK